MFKIEETKKIGAYLAKLIDKKYESRRKFCGAYIKLDGGIADEESLRKMSNRLSQIIKGVKSIQTYDLPIFAELLEVSCEEILTAGKYVIPNARRMTNYDIVFSKDEKAWEKYIHRDDKLILNSDEYGKNVIEYALECKNYKFLKYLVENKYIWFVGENDKDFAYTMNFGAGTSIKRRNPVIFDSLELEMFEKKNLRSQMIALAIDNNDFKMLTDLKAREIPSLYRTSYLAVNMPDCHEYYDADMVEHIAESNNEKIISYFSDEFEIQAQYDKQYIFVFPYINELIDLLLKRKSKYADMVLVKAIAHNKNTYEKLKKLIADAYDGYRKDSYWGNDEKHLNQYANECIARELDYYEDGNMINFRQVFTSGIKSSQIDGITTNIVYVYNHSPNAVTQHFIEEVNDYYNKIRELIKNPISEG